jgi:hypothetical protein
MDCLPFLFFLSDVSPGVSIPSEIACMILSMIRSRGEAEITRQSRCCHRGRSELVQGGGRLLAPHPAGRQQPHTLRPSAVGVVSNLSGAFREALGTTAISLQLRRNVNQTGYPNNVPKE